VFSSLIAHRPSEDGGVHKDYWLTDGLYGSFNCILYDDQRPTPHVLRSPLLPPVPEGGELYQSTLWGPTCDSADYVYKDIALPELRNGDWLLFPSSGAYTVAGACDFNGIAMTHPTVYYVYSNCAVDDGDDSDGSGEVEEEEEEEEEEKEKEKCGDEKTGPEQGGP
jgi:ornithine decarboxylase